MKSHSKKGRPWPSLAERFDGQHVIVAESGCWIWTGHMSATGYGQIKESYATKAAHRVSWELKNGPIADGLFVCHRCDVRCCVNPDHLFLGTCKDNVQDMHKKGRGADRAGIKHPRATVTDETISEIKRLSADGVMGKDIAARFDLSRGYVSQLINGVRRANQRAAERGYGSAA